MLPKKSKAQSILYIYLNYPLTPLYMKEKALKLYISDTYHHVKHVYIRA
jgi:hypothetical protein